MGIPKKVKTFHQRVEHCVSEFLAETRNDDDITGVDAIAAIGTLGVSLIQHCAEAMDLSTGKEAASNFLHYSVECLENLRLQYVPSKESVDRVTH